MRRRDPDRPEFSRPVPLDAIDAAGITHTLRATERERAGLAQRFGFAGIERLEAELTVRRTGTEAIIRVAGRLAAEVVQECVVTLEPTRRVVEEEIDERFAPAAGSQRGEVVVDAEDDEPEPLEGESIDLGEVVAQCLALAVDSYPRAPGVEFAGFTLGGGEEGDAVQASPFAVLSALQKRHRDGA